MLGAAINTITAAIAPQPGARGGGANPAHGAAEVPLPVPAAGDATADAAHDAARSIQPALGPEATRGLVLSQATELQSAASQTSDAAPPDGLGAGERDVIRQMASRDREVHQHEQAHARAGGAHAGSPSFSYQTGPDGRRYAVAGSVPIDTAPVKGDPEATIVKMSVVIAAALAPASPSGPDRRIAAQAQSTRLAAIAELGVNRASITGGRSAGEPEDDATLTGQLFTSLTRPEPGGEVSRAV